jgi:hypothetical protein
MRMLFDGVEASKLTVFKGHDSPSHRMTFLEDDGTPIDLTGYTVTLEVFDKKTRDDPASQSHAAVLDVAAGGHVTLSLDDAAMNYGPGTFFGYGQIVNGGITRLGTEPVEITVN